MADRSEWRETLREARVVAADESQPDCIRIALRHHLDEIDAMIEWFCVAAEAAR